MDKLVSIGKAAKILGVSEVTLRRLDEDGKLVSTKTEGGHRRYDISQISPEKVHKFAFQEAHKTIAYARVGSVDQKEELENQIQTLELFCLKNGWTFEIISDIGSGVDYYKKGLSKLVDAIVRDEVGRLVLTNKDRLLRFGAELIFSICEAKGVEVVFLNKGDDPAFEDDLGADILEMVSIFSARLYGISSKKNKRLLEDMAKAVEVCADEPERHEPISPE